MKSSVEQSLWFKDGLRFQCTGCGNCCTGGPGYIWINSNEIAHLAQFLKLSITETRQRYCRKLDGQISLKEKPKNARGEYDCLCLRETAADASGGKPTKRTCAIYAVRPLQCRTWPFWEGNLATPEAWLEAGKRCPGINTGRLWPLNEILARRNATNWPEDA